MPEREKTLDELLNSLPPEALVAVSLILKEEAIRAAESAERLSGLGLKAAELAKFKGMN